MIHTAVTALLILTSPGSWCPERSPQGKTYKTPQNPAITKVIENLRSREKALKSVTLEMSTIGSYPSGLTFRTDGTLRVLGTTHFHIDVTTRFVAAEVSSRLEKVIRPDGVWTFQEGPMEKKYTHMDKELMERLKLAERALAADKDTAMRNPGPMAGKGDAPLGSAMLAALDLQFELEIQKESRKFAGVECKVISGQWRGFKGLAKSQIDDKDFPRAVQRVEVFLRATDGIPIRMVQYNKSKVLYVKDDKGEDVPQHVEAVAFELNIKNLKLDPKIEAASFQLKAPEGTKFIPVMDHRSSRAQINRILEEYEDLKESRKPASPPVKKSGK